ncbi:Bardet-Biedl syndrome 7 protein homolog [Cimex lectularius]|uniref:Bardet-Biedl syndrome 7 protein homolog n=1 Tax=Cimex lectularius TaxID=79782 RepID=A0A8I6TLV1_CIMLE|nr:Bardet-Biedl syndrome 7 protein homolog [Cimex lectularius]
MLEFTRVDYALLGLSSPNCMKILQNTGAKGPQKVVFSGSDGVLQVFSFKKGEMHISFKTLPGEIISCLELGGSDGGQEKIFVSSKNEVRGYTKKGKLFLGFDTNLTEPIRSMHVTGNDLLVAGSHVYNHYKDCRDVNSYLSSDTINDIVALNVEKTHRLTAILACEDRVLRVLDRSNLSQVLPLQSVPTLLSLLYDNGGTTGDNLVYAMENGQIGLVQIMRNNALMKWTIDNTKQRGAVRCMCWYDITKDGVQELIVGRDDGSIQIYGEPMERVSDNESLVEKYNYICNESITSIQAGFIGSAQFDEILATTYTGWLFGLTTEVLEKQVSLDMKNSGVSIKLSTEDKLKIERLRAEIEELERAVLKERERYQLLTQEDSIGISVTPLLKITDKMILVKEKSILQLTIETETPIDNVLLQSNVTINLLDVEQNSAVVSHSKCHKSSGNKLLATYRCQVNTTKLSISLQCSSESGTLNVYVTPQTHPKTTHLRTFTIRHLGLYSRTHDFDDTRPCNTLTLKGGFSMAEMHNWISKCLPEMSEKIPTQDNMMYNYISSFTGAIIQCTYMKGEAEFKSDDITTIAILKDFLTKEATMKKIEIELSFVINDESTKHCLSLIFPKLQLALQTQKQARLLEALKDIEINDRESILSLTPGCKEVLDQQSEISKNFKHQAFILERIEDVIMHLFIDWCRFANINGRSKLLNLKEKLRSCNLEELLEFFETSTPE